MKIRFLILLSGLALLLTIAGVLRGEWHPGVIRGEASSDLPAVTSEMQSWLNSEMRRRGIPGMAIAVVRDGELKETVALGVANTWTRQPLTVDSLMEVGSISKIITALAAMREISGGRLSLNQPLTEYRPDFNVEGEYRNEITLAMLLTHTAGLNNSIENQAIADQPPGREYRYSGQGFELTGELISSGHDMSLADTFRHSVLTPLGLSASATHGEPSAGDQLASPHVSVSLPFLLFLLEVFAVLLVGGGLVWIVRRLRGRRGPAGTKAATILLMLAISAGLATPFFLFRSGNSLRMMLVNIGLVALLATIAWSWRQAIFNRYRADRMLITSLAVAIFALITFWRPPMPVEDRNPSFPATAGFRASVVDMGQLLVALLSPPPEWQDEIAMLTTPLVRANDENSWGPGIGIQQIDGETTIWHWGINFPGYQALMLGRPATGDGVVLLANGGPMIFAPGGARYAGLELEREVAARLMPGAHGAYWHGLQ
jgi:CubicO group peptidase (beta-lactamase class C family)